MGKKSQGTYIQLDLHVLLELHHFGVVLGA